MAKVHAHTRLKNWLLSYIRAHRIGDLLPSQRELMKKFGMSHYTLNRVMHELINDGYIERRRGDGTYIQSHEKPLFTSRQTLQGESEIIFCYDHRRLSPHILDAIDNVSRQQKTTVIHFQQSMQRDYTRLCHFAKDLPNLKGIIIAPDAHGLPASAYSPLTNLDQAVVFLNPPPRLKNLAKNFFIVSPDYHQGAKLAIKWFYQHGHRKFCYMGDEDNQAIQKLHLGGIKEALYDHKLNYRHCIKLSSLSTASAAPLEAGRKMTELFIEKHNAATALIYSSDQNAIAGLSVLHANGVIIPEELSILGQGNDIHGQYCFPELTTMQIDHSEQISMALEIITKPLNTNTKQVHTLPFRMINRDSIHRCTNQ